MARRCGESVYWGVRRVIHSVWLASAMAAGMCIGGGAALGQAGRADSAAFVSRLDGAFRRNDAGEMERILREAMTTEVGCELCWKVMQCERADLRVVGASVLASMADAEALARTAQRLDVVNRADERRLLVRAIGPRAAAWRSDRKERDPRGPGGASGKDIEKLLAPFMDDRDKMVRAAAVQALADCGRGEMLERMTGSLGLAPVQVRKWNTTDDTSVVTMAVYGAVASVTGLRPESAAQVREWLAAHRGALAGAEDGKRPWEEGAAVETLPVMRGGRLQTPSLIVRFETKEMRAPGDVSGDEWQRLVETFERGCSRARSAAEGVFGTAHLPPIQLILADDSNIASYGGTAKGYFGFSLGNCVVMRVGRPVVMESVLAHEFVHIIHQANYRSQPRWIMEGMAESLSKSAVSSGWPARIRHASPELQKRLATGAVSGVIRWTSSGSSGEPYELYEQGHLVVDYLRFGGFTCPEARLNVLMGRLARGESADRALRDAYGMTVAEMDRGVLKWLGMGK
jgi:hypothetical protein